MSYHDLHVPQQVGKDFIRTHIPGKSKYLTLKIEKDFVTEARIKISFYDEKGNYKNPEAILKEVMMFLENGNKS